MKKVNKTSYLYGRCPFYSYDEPGDYKLALKIPPEIIPIHAETWRLGYRNADNKRYKKRGMRVEYFVICPEGYVVRKLTNEEKRNWKEIQIPKDYYIAAGWDLAVGFRPDKDLDSPHSVRQMELRIFYLNMSIEL